MTLLTIKVREAQPGDRLTLDGKPYNSVVHAVEVSRGRPEQVRYVYEHKNVVTGERARSGWVPGDNLIEIWREMKAALPAALVALSVWLDEHNAAKPVGEQRWERVGKVGEEFGEVVQAMIGVAGQNPRKGVTHDIMDVVDELLDVAITALGAVEHLTGNQGEAFAMLERKLVKVVTRAGLVS